MIRKAAAVIIKDNKLLTVKSRNVPVYISPGGKYEGNESPLECLSRELMEELGVTVRAVKHYKDYHELTPVKNEPLLLETYFVTYDGTPKASSEIMELYAASADEIIRDERYASGMKRMVPDLRNDGFLD